MFNKFLSTTAVVLAATQLASAQTSTACDPRKKSCPADPAVGKENTVNVDFTKGPNDFFHELVGTKLTYDEHGAVFTINKETDAPTIQSDKYIFFGKVDVTLKAATGVGVVTSFVLQSDDLDEIDWEWLGGDTTQVQTNYFGKGDTTTYDRGGFSGVSNPQNEFHTYTIDWTKDYVRWIIDGQQVRELKYADAKGGSEFPQTPCQIKLGTWVAGRSDAPEGTVQWAGGKTDFSQAPFLAYYKSITIQDYSNGVANAKEYVWDDGSDGSWQSINVVTGNDNEDRDGDDDTTTTATATKTGTVKPTGSATEDSTTTDASTTASATSKTTPTTLSTATSSGPVASSGSAEETGAPSTTADAASEISASPSSSASVVPTNGALKTGFSGVVLCVGLFAAFIL
ncbi:concanavalin A-like lectin/glucanase domain-containing protein [Biscogniauxia marginata]|nr:concanavalin A-like lectin/glucanase domain-containing protein [Biscogniauxia marginata]